MRNRLLSMIALALVAIGMNAQTWTEPAELEPEKPDRTTVSDPVSGHVYEIRNVESQRYVAGTQVWFSWNTTAALVDPENDQLEPIRFTATLEEAGWTFKGFDGGWPGCYIFVSGNGGQGSFANDPNTVGWAMHVDNATDVHRYYELLKQESGAYRIRIAENDATYGKAVANDWENRFWGWSPTDEAQPKNLHASVKPEDGYACDFEFIDWSSYSLVMDRRQKLYDLATTIVNDELDVDYEAYSDIYYGSDYDAMQEAYEALTVAVRIARVAKTLEGATKDNPANGTSLLVNPAFDQGTQWDQPPGWTVEAMGDNNCWQNNNTFSGDDGSFLNQFMESWKPDALRDGGMYQTVKYLPAGEYTLECDAMTNRDYAGADVKGVELFATGGDITTTTPVATYSNKPQHFSLRFVSTGGDMVLGLRTRSTNTNWICADNFTLWYYGETDNPYKLALDNAINEAEETYNLDEVKAYQDAKTAYTTALNTAKATSASEGLEDQDYIDARDALNEAIVEFQAAIAIYTDFQQFIDNWNDKNLTMSDPSYAEGKWAGAFGTAMEELEGKSISDMLYELQESHDNCDISEKDILAAEDAISIAFAAYVSKNVEKGDDLSFMLVNPGFDDKDAEGKYKGFYGWDVNEGTEEDAMVTPAWGGEDPQYTDPVSGETMTAEGGNAEVYRAKFEISQTIKNMPAGLYTLSCKAFERDDNNNGVTAELFAILGNGNVQSVKIKNLLDDGSETQLYDGTTGGGGKNVDKLSNGLYRPDGMCSANVYFAIGKYRNRFNILLEERSDLTIGIRDLTGGNTWGSSGDWVLFDDFQIAYKGEDATAYVETIQELIDQLNKMEEDGAVYTEETKGIIDEARTDGDDMIDNAEDETTENAKKVVADLEAAIARGKAISARYREIQREFIIDWQYRYDVAGVLPNDEGEINLPDTEGFMGWMDDMSAYFGDGAFDAIPDELFETDEDLENVLTELRTRFTVYAQEVALEEATEEEPANITAVIWNPDCLGEWSSDGNPVGEDGWTIAKGSVGYGSDVAEINAAGKAILEFYAQKEFDINQTIYGLAPGFYRIVLPAIYRQGSADDVQKALTAENAKEGEEATGQIGLMKRAKLYAASEEAITETPLLRIIDDMENYTAMITENGSVEPSNKSAKITLGEETSYIPNTVYVANQAFENDMYQNILQFEVVEDQESVTIGIRKDALDTEDFTDSNDWCVWGAWQLLYLGAEEPSENPTTAIQAVEVAQPAQATVIYNLAGQRVQKALKGVYIINGKKVLK